MNDFSVHFTLKAQSLDEIKSKLGKWLAASNKRITPHTVLHHCFLPREVVIAKGFDTSVVDYLDELAPNQVCWYNASPKGLGVSRFLMLQNLQRVGGTALFVGKVQDGASEEYDHLSMMQIKNVLIS